MLSNKINNIQLRKAQRDDFEGIARLIANQNKIPAQHCIQSETGKDEESIWQEMIKLDKMGEFCGVVAMKENRLVGVLGCEIAEAIGRGWLRGPFVLTDNWTQLAVALFEQLLEILPTTIHRLDSFLITANEQGNDFYLQQGFQQIGLVHVYGALRDGALRTSFESCHILRENQRRSFIALHDTIFPTVYLTGEGVLAQIDEDHQVFVYANGDEVLGSLYAVIEDGGEEGYIEFLGVRADVRGQGIGKQLLLTALHWLFEIKRLPQVGLTVNDNLTNARLLYEKVGFKLKYTGVHSKKLW